MTLPLNQVLCGDCLKLLKDLPSESIDCVVTDPPYGIGFMGKDWDMALPPKAAFDEMFRVLKPGALAFVMSSPRQDVLWRMLKMLEECGFRLGQSFLSWIYKSGFPKAYDISKGIDKKLGKEPQIVGQYRHPDGKPRNWQQHKTKRKGIYHDIKTDDSPNQRVLTKGASDVAKKWQGYKSVTGLKPALECILMVQKPLSEPTIVDNVLRHGVGAINVDACRIPFNKRTDEQPRIRDGKTLCSKVDNQIYGKFGDFENAPYFDQKGRFPANLLVSNGALDEVGRQDKGTKPHPVKSNIAKYEGWGTITKKQGEIVNYGDSGTASRYFSLDAWAAHHGFFDVPKASKSERDKGLEKFYWHNGNRITKEAYIELERENKHLSRNQRHRISKANIHPTVKPIQLNAYLIELGCPPHGVVLDPFCGTGATLIAAHQLGRPFIGIEIRQDYKEIAEARLQYWQQSPYDRERYDHKLQIHEQAKDSQRLTEWT